jgi:hypothetical protein
VKNLIARVSFNFMNTAKAMTIKNVLSF